MTCYICCIDFCHCKWLLFYFHFITLLMYGCVMASVFSCYNQQPVILILITYGFSWLFWEDLPSLCMLWQVCLVFQSFYQSYLSYFRIGHSSTVLKGSSDSEHLYLLMFHHWIWYLLCIFVGHLHQVRELLVLVCWVSVTNEC